MSKKNDIELNTVILNDMLFVRDLLNHIEFKDIVNTISDSDNKSSLYFSHRDPETSIPICEGYGLCHIFKQLLVKSMISDISYAYFENKLYDVFDLNENDYVWDLTLEGFEHRKDFIDNIIDELKIININTKFVEEEAIVSIHYNICYGVLVNEICKNIAWNRSDLMLVPIVTKELFQTIKINDFEIDVDIIKCSNDKTYYRVFNWIGPFEVDKTYIYQLLNNDLN